MFGPDVPCSCGDEWLICNLENAVKRLFYDTLMCFYQGVKNLHIYYQLLAHMFAFEVQDLQTYKKGYTTNLNVLFQTLPIDL